MAGYRVESICRFLTENGVQVDPRTYRNWVTNFTYVPTWSGFVYVALVIDCFSRAIMGWQVAKTKDTAMVTTALKVALGRRDHHGHTGSPQSRYRTNTPHKTSPKARRSTPPSTSSCPSKPRWTR
ncbi:DDE-type integrase/transposase/recombinase [Mycolicibacterium sphagni]|uniref:DDE-type integrase/transposase/recombinase n=1 Tax=Mycolicibacterium sphagni TaxID=1786 RepID=UPI0013FD42BE